MAERSRLEPFRKGYRSSLPLPHIASHGDALPLKEGARALLSRRGVLGGALALGAAACTSSAPAVIEPLDVIAFPGGFNLPIWAAEKNGFFADEGVGVTLHFTPGSEFQINGLLEGDFDVAMTALDNVIAYREGQGAFRHDRESEIAAFLASDDGFLSLVSQSQFDSVDALRGQTLAVDALTTGYAFVLFAILASAGVAQDDVTFESFGGVMARWETLQKGEHAGTMLVTPFDVFAQRAGFNKLATTAETIGAYQGVVAATLRDPEPAKAEQLAAFSRAYVRALQWMAEPGNRADASAILQEQLEVGDPALLEDITSALLRPGGFSQTGTLEDEAFRNVLDLRRTYAGGIEETAGMDRYFVNL